MDLSTYNTAHQGLPNLDWSKCGVYRDEGDDPRGTHRVMVTEVCAKVLRTGRLAVMMPKMWLIKC